MSKLKEVLVTRSNMPVCGLKILEQQCNLTIWNNPGPISRKELLKNAVGKQGIFCTLSDNIDKELLEAAGPDLEVISTMSVGYDHIDVEECKKRGIRLGHTPNVLTDATAELTVALLLAISRRLLEAIHEAKTGGWISWDPTWMIGPGLSGATVGIFGFGRIGQAVAKRIKAFNPKIILFTSRKDIPEADAISAKRVHFETMIRESDFVICTSALVPETKEVFNKSVFEKMKTTAIFVNTSRGGLVDQNALIEALENKTIRAAGLDVTTPEPLPVDNQLFNLNNCIVLPHIGNATIEARNAMSELGANNILAALNKKAMPAEV